MRALSVVGLVLASLTLGCTPSIRMVERGNTYFERCHAADRDPEVGDAHRLRCWEAWLDHYTEGQAVERIRHARERVVALAVALRLAEASAETTGGGEALVDAGPAETIVDAGPAAALTDAGPSETIVDAGPAAALADAGPAGPPGPLALERPATSSPPPAASCPARPEAAPGVACPSPPDDVAGPCADVCRPRWYACVSRCRGYERRCLNACRAEHRTCMAGCF